MCKYVYFTPILEMQLPEHILVLTSLFIHASTSKGGHARSKGVQSFSFSR